MQELILGYLGCGVIFVLLITLCTEQFKDNLKLAHFVLTVILWLPLLIIALVQTVRNLSD